MNVLKSSKTWIYRALVTFSIIQITITVFYLMVPNLNFTFINAQRPNIIGSIRRISISDSQLIMTTRSSIQYIPYPETQNSSYFALNQTKVFHKCPERPWVEPDGRYNLSIDNTTYFKHHGNMSCLISGTNMNETFLVNRNGNCKCLQNWTGIYCSIPKSVTDSNLPARYVLTPRFRNPRRIIQAFPFNIEFEMFEARLAEFGDLVDVFLILESNFTAHGDPKPVHLLEKLRKGNYKKYACKIVHIFLDYFPSDAHKNGWIADNLLRNYISQHGLLKQLTGYKHDDIFLLTDADEIPLRETILFLKLHDGYPEPFAFNLHWTVWGFFWKANKKAITHIFSGLTVGMLFHVFRGNAIQIRNAPSYIQNEGAVDLTRYLHHEGNVSVHPWSFGNEKYPAGWHCSWCCDPKCIQTKLMSAQNGDFPRWGDFPDKRKLTYITYLIRNGMWFDNISKMIKVDPLTQHIYAPSHLLWNTEKYRHLLINLYNKTP